MSQIKKGTVTVANGSAVVTGDDDVDWTNVHDGALFTVATSAAPWFVAGDARPPGANVSGKWELTLSAPFNATEDGAGLRYAISIDFSPTFDFVLENFGDGRGDLLQRRNMARIEEVLAGLTTGATIFFMVSVPIAGALIGVDTIPVVFDPALATPPSHVGRPVFEKGNPSEDNVDAISVDSITRFGLNVNLNAPAVEGQILHCQIIP